MTAESMRRSSDLWEGTRLEATILAMFRPGYGRFKRDIVAEMQPAWGSNSISRCMRDMRRRGLIRYAQGQGYWALPNYKQGGQDD